MILKFDKNRSKWYCPIEIDTPFYSPITNEYYKTYDELEIDVKKFNIKIRKQKIQKINELSKM